jgi:hypothetical protein
VSIQAHSQYLATVHGMRDGSYVIAKRPFPSLEALLVAYRDGCEDGLQVMSADEWRTELAGPHPDCDPGMMSVVSQVLYEVVFPREGDYARE